MLQIISGKFFKGEDRHRFDAFGILYSNVACWRPIVTSVATLHPVDPHGSATRYVITYTNQIERESDLAGGISLARTGDAEIVEQFRLLLILGLRGFFATERRDVEHACRTRPAYASDHVPSRMMDRFFDARVDADAEDMARCETLIGDVLGLPRKSYLAVMSYVANFVDALQAADTNIDLGYSMLMYGIEALSQQFGVFEPTWEDYDPKVKARIDELLTHEPQILESVRGALLQSTHLRIQHRTAAFVEQYLPDSFFEGAHVKQRKSPLRRSFVRRSIRNAYRLRSKFVHELERGEGLDRAFGDFDVLTRKNEPLLTFRGLVRVAEQVVPQFVETQERVETEDIEWRSELPGIVKAEMAPQYWIWRADTFQPTRAHDRLSAFLGQLEEATTVGGSVTDLRAVLLRIEELITKKQSSSSQRRAMACLYVLYHTLVKPNPDLELITENENVRKRCDDLLNETCSMEALLRDLLFGQDFGWPRDECSAVVSAYYRSQKFEKGCLKLPPQMEAALLAAVGNMYLGPPLAVDTASEWLRKARLELGGHPEKQAYLKSCAENAVKVENHRLLRPWSEAPKADGDLVETDS